MNINTNTKRIDLSAAEIRRMAAVRETADMIVAVAPAESKVCKAAVAVCDALDELSKLGARIDLSPPEEPSVPMEKGKRA